MLVKRMLLVALLVVAVVFLASCNAFSPETRSEVLTQQNCLRGCIDRCPQEMASYGGCATRCGTMCRVAGEQQQSR
jgi:hypothetical protein